MAFLLHYKRFIMRNYIVFFTSVLLVLFTGSAGFAQACTNTSVTSFQPASGPENTIITVTGSGFQFGSGVSAVQFGTTPAIFTLVSDTQLTATVPVAAVSGNITLIANGGCLAASPTAFTVLSSNCSSPEIYISEVYDAQAGSPGAIELYNPTNAAITFNGQYVLERYGNATDLNPTNGYSLTLTGSIPANSTYLVRSGPAPCNLTINAVMGSGINENDAVKLRKNGAVIDVVNAPDEVGYTIIRNANAIAPSGTAFVASQWTTSSQEQCGNLGTHSANPATIPVPGVLEPESTTVCQNSEAVFSTGVSGAGFTYQWKILNTSGIWTNLSNGGNYSGTTSDTLIISNAPFSLNASQFYCQITSSTCTLVTAAAQLTVTVIPAPTLAAVQPTCSITTGSITITAPTGTGYTYSIDGINYQISATFNALVPNTYGVTVQDSNGCISLATSQTINTPAAAPAAPTVTAVQPTCTTPTGTITITAPTGNTLTYSIDGTNYQASPIFNNLTPATYSVTVKNTDGCISSATSQIINALPATPAAPTVTAVQPTCTTPTGTINITAPTGTGITYSIDGVNYQASATFTGLTAATYLVSVKNADGCISSETSQVINTPPAPPAAPTVAAVQPTCTTPTGTINITAPTGTGLTYSIDGTNYQASATFTGLTPGTYPVTVQNTNGCISSATSQIINAAPATPAAPTVTVTQPTCVASGTLVVTAPAGTGFTYSINGINYQASTTFNNLSAGNYPVTVKNAAGCISTATSQTINAAPQVPAVPVTTATQPTCTTATGSITVTSPTGAGLTYSIDGINYQASVTFNNLTAGATYTITVKNTAGCTASSTKAINPVPAAPAAPIVTNVQPTCTVATGSITVTSPTGSGVTYSIDGTTYQTATTFGNLAPGTYSITAKNAAGCISAITTQVINTAPSAPATPTFAAIQPNCTTATGSITITAPLGPGFTYSIDGTNYQAGATFNNLTPGNYTIVVKNTAGCTASATQIINTVPTTPAIPAIAVVQPTCAVPTGKLTVTSPVNTSLTYSVDGITYQSSPVFTGLGGGTYTITVQNTAGCTAVSAPVSVDAPPAPAPDPGIITGDTAVCADGTLQLSNTTTGGIWASSNTNIATVDATGLVTAIAAGTVNITYTTGTVCTAAATQSITIQPLPRPSFADAYYLCVDNQTSEATPIVLNSGLSETDYTFTWTKDNELLADTTSSIIIDEPGEYSVTATNIATGCIGTNTTTVANSSLAIASAEVGQDFSASQVITINVTGGSGDYEYSVDGEPFQDEPRFTGITSGEHTILVRDKNGCGTIELEVFALNYPHYFSANHDGTQDAWNIKGLSSQYNAIIFIYDRYGKLITSVRPGAAGWDGTYNGHTLPATDYWFKILYRSPGGINKEFKAHFALIR